MSAERLFVVVFALFSCLLNCAVGTFVIDWSRVSNVILLLLFQMLLLRVAYELSSLLFVFLLRKKELPALKVLKESPPVALLYVTYNDVISECLISLQNLTYTNCDIFILDDSTEREQLETIDRIAARFDFRVIRRGTRRGYKAGSLNYWFMSFGADYKYFAVLDADSKVSEDFLEQMLRFAEYPDNARIALFQSKIKPWNTDRLLPRVMAQMFPVFAFELDILTSRCALLPSWGHNNLYRTESLAAVGGFDERFISEDVATGLDLQNHGYSCRLVDVTSFEMFPPRFTDYAVRNRRWARQSIQLELHKQDIPNVSFTTKLHIFMAMYTYVSSVILVAAISFIVLSSKSTVGEVAQFVNSLVRGQYMSLRFVGSVALLGFLIAYVILPRLALSLKLRMPIRKYVQFWMVTTLLGIYSLVPTALAVLRSLYKKTLEFSVTPKNSSTSSGALSQALPELKHLLLLVGLVGLGVARNPGVLLFGWFWLIPLLISPIGICVLTHLDNKGRRFK